MLEHERIRTTDAKAKGVRSLAEKMITLGKRGDLHARRRALRVIRRREVAAKLFDDLAERYRERAGGYTRIVKADVRPGDAAAMSIIELVEAGAPQGRESKTAKKGSKKATATKKAAKKSDEAAAETKSKAKKSTKKKASAKSGEEKSAKATTKKKTASKKKATAKKKSD